MVVPADKKLDDGNTAWISTSFLLYAFTRWLGVRKTCEISLFSRYYRSLLEKTLWLGSKAGSYVIRNTLAGSKIVVSIGRNDPVEKQTRNGQ